MIISSVSHDNADPSGENADGFAAKLTVGPENVFRYCVAHNNSDDGWDLYTKSETGPIGAVTIEDSIAYENGTLSDGRTFDDGDKNGFKLGGENIAVSHIIRNNLAFKNGKRGFTYNRNPGAIRLENNTAVNNDKQNFKFPEHSAILSNNLSCNIAPALRDTIEKSSVDANRWWQGINVKPCPPEAAKAVHWSFTQKGRLEYQFR